MKKLTLLLAGCVALTASANVKEGARTSRADALQANKKVELNSKMATPSSRVMASESKLIQKRAQKRAGETLPLMPMYKPQSNVMAFGFSENGYSFNGVLGFQSSYGETSFYNCTIGAESYNWTYSNVNGEDQLTFNGFDLSINNGVGYAPTPVLDAFSASSRSSYEGYAEGYYMGGSANYYAGKDNDEGDFGVTFNQNFGLKAEDQYLGSSTYMYSYQPGAAGYSPGGAYVTTQNRSWQSVLQSRYGTEVTESNDTIVHPVSNIAVVDYNMHFPAPNSEYFFSKGWIWMNVTAKQATQLTSYVYVLEEDGTINEERPIAMGVANISVDQSPIIVFNYYPLDEDGDPYDDVVYINSAIEVTIEGFAGNPAISSLNPVQGYNLFDYNIYSANDYEYAPMFTGNPMLRNRLSFTMDGETRIVNTYDPSLYSWDDSQSDMVIDLNVPNFFMNATFNFIISSNGEKYVEIDMNGGTKSIDLEAYYYQIKRMVEIYDPDLNEGYCLQYPDWLDVELSDPDEETGATTMTITASAASEPRRGAITINGTGATYSLMVHQGESGVSTVSLEKGAEYYDLMGRRVMNPDKGIFIKKNGKKATKVIF